DRSGRMEVVVGDELYQRARNAIVKDTILVVDCVLRYDDYSDAWRGDAREIMDLDQLWERCARRLDIFWQAPEDATGTSDAQRFASELRDALTPHRAGNCQVNIFYRSAAARACLALGEDWRVRPTRQLLDRLHSLTGGRPVKLVYAQQLDA
ncbi:MAG: DNA polymerase III subunit alpha, partial [Pseudomonadota bacterium]